MTPYRQNDSMLFKDSRLKKLPVVLVHLFIWLVIFSLPMLFRPDHGPHGPARDLPLPIPFPMLMNNVFLVIAFYVNLLVLMPRFFNKKRWGYFLLFTILFLVASLFIHQFSQSVEHLLWGETFKPKFPRMPERNPAFHERNLGFEFRQFSFLYLFLMTWAISMVYHLFVQLQESMRRADQVLATALQSELSFLKAQINPHFLFNTLNNIYVLTLKKSDQAPVAVMQLSNLMRKITDDTDVDFVPFAEEEQFIRDYLELQQLRQSDKSVVRFEMNGSHAGLHIAPRLLIPFIDNAFKYGISNHHPSEIIIRMDFEGNKLRFLIRNSVHSGTNDLHESSGIGLDNTKRRLELLYKDRYELHLNKTEESHEVLLQIELS